MSGISLLLGIHVVCGTLALSSLLIPFLSKWGGTIHRRAGWLFSLAMGGVSLTAWALSTICLVDGIAGNDADAIFLAHVGLLSGSSVWMGLRAARLKHNVDQRRWTDVAWPGSLLLSSAGIFIAGILSGDILWIIFSVIGALGAIGPLRYLLGRGDSRNEWMVQHLGSMGTGAISAVTAFLVVNGQGWGLGGFAIVLWIAPGIFGGIALSLLGARVRKHGLASPR
ncbi:MAG: hypothetical protein ABIW76_09330 [Fibrobacteria bacterium]